MIIYLGLLVILSPFLIITKTISIYHLVSLNRIKTSKYIQFDQNKRRYLLFLYKKISKFFVWESWMIRLMPKSGGSGRLRRHFVSFLWFFWVDLWSGSRFGNYLTVFGIFVNFCEFFVVFSEFFEKISEWAKLRNSEECEQSELGTVRG